MKRVIRCTTGRSTSREYIKMRLFEYLCDDPGLNIDGIGLEEAVDRIEGLGPIFDVDDVLERTIDDGESFSSALYNLESEAEIM